MKIKAIITGSTGMVGEGVLYICLDSPEVESVSVVNRKPCGVEHPKLKEIIHKDFLDLSPIEDQLTGYNACYFCAGVSSIGKKEEEYRKITYDITLNFAKTLIKTHGSTKVYTESDEVLTRNNTSIFQEDSSRAETRDEKVDMVFTYVSGVGADSSEMGKSMWARVKGKTENDILKLPFKGAYAYRPGYIQPIKGQKYSYKFYKFFSPLYPVLKKLFPKYVGAMEELGNSMINVTLNGYDKKVLEVEDIRKTGKSK